MAALLCGVFRMKKLTAVVAALLLCVNASAGEIDLSFNSDALRLLYVNELAGSDLQWDAGVAHNSDTGTLITGSLYVAGLAADGSNPLQAGVGARTGYIDGEESDQSGLPLAVGGFLQYTFPRLNRLSVRADAWFAPDILTLGDLDKYQDYSIRLQYAVLRQANVYIGARYLSGEFSNDSKALIDNGLNVGLNFSF